MTAAAVQMLIDIQEELDFAKEQSEQMKEGLKNAMIENGVNVWDAGRLRASVDSRHNRQVIRHQGIPD